MKLVKELQMMIVVGAVAALAATPGYSQTTAPKPAGTAPATQAPATPAAPPAAAQPAPQAPRPFPEGAKFAFVDIQASRRTRRSRACRTSSRPAEPC
jgi:hypothetical protein